MKPVSSALETIFNKQCHFDKTQIEKLYIYGCLLEQWQKAINLVSPASLSELWERHLLDSAQLWPVIQKFSPHNVIDLGSGGGLPGLVLGIAGVPITLVESDVRKCVFLREVSRETKLTNVTILNERIENIKDLQADIVTARALAPLKKLIDWSQIFLKENGKMVFMKGRDAALELTKLPIESQEKACLIPSITDKNSHIIVI